MKAAITKTELNSWSKAYQNDPARRIATRALCKTDMNNAMYVNEAAGGMRQKFSVEIKTLPVTNQKRSGRCWLFAAANVLRERIAKEKNLEQFELSQSYLAFWDKFERCNYFLEAMIELADRPADDRTVAFLLNTGVHDGGQWDMFVNIVNKYGVVPKDAYDETWQSCNTAAMNHYLNRNLKICAAKLRGMARSGASEADIRKEKGAMLGKIYAFLCSCYGEPPKRFDFEYVDQDGTYGVERGFTPAAFRDRYVGKLLNEMVSIINAPTDDKEWHKVYTVKYLGNVVGGNGVRHLNLKMQEFKDAVIRQLKDGKVVWFGSDVGKFGDREAGIWDDEIFDAELLTGLDLKISKADSLDYGFAAMNHAMVITGVNLDEKGRPTRWKIENSWGDEHGTKGYYICSDTWFDAYVFQAAVERSYLGGLARYADQKAIELAPWDPMGTLAD